MPRGNPSKARGRPRGGSRLEAQGPNTAAGRPRRPVQIHNGSRGLRLDRRAVAAAVHCLDARAFEILGPAASAHPPSAAAIRRATHDVRPSPHFGVPPGALSVAFLAGPALAALHGRFLGDPSATDVMTFPGDAAVGHAGEICISVDAARAFAEKRAGDFSAELTLYLVHGWLHLAGHDDHRPAGQRRMRAAEARAMALLRRARAVPRFSHR